MRFPWVAHDNLLGEPAIEEPGHRITASLFDGDPQFVFDIILDVGADPSVRFWQWHALTLIGLEGSLDRTVAADFARQAFGKLSRDEEKPLIWAGWEKLISRLALTDLAPLVRKAHDADLLVESTYEEFQQDLEYAVAHPDAPCRPGDELEALAGVRELAVGGIVTPRVVCRARSWAVAVISGGAWIYQCLPIGGRAWRFCVFFYAA